MQIITVFINCVKISFLSIEISRASCVKLVNLTIVISKAEELSISERHVFGITFAISSKQYAIVQS